ncbi:MAG: ribosomal RNA small subunit methyltransferase I [bacterium]|nr:ribosomal RNA small subunit methyltransferase I [bacterium]
MSTLFVVGTPIGNLNDISQRAQETLKLVDYILCEDTRVSQKMLTRFGIKKPMISYHQHSKLDKVDYILGLLCGGKNLALISDAGTPGISDPGNKLVDAIVNQYVISERPHKNYTSEELEKAEDEIEIIPIPGPSAITAIASVCGFPMDRFIFLGFPPIKKKRKQFFEEVLNSKYPVIFFESPYRILKTLNELWGTVPLKNEGGLSPQELQVVVGRELTKKFETIYRGSITEIIEAIKKSPIKGEFVVVVSK